MNIQRVIGKLRREGPFLLGRKAIWQGRRMVLHHRRRRRWSASAASAGVTLPGGAFVNAAQQLWPGLADIAWRGEASDRWPQEYAEATGRASDAASGRFDLLGSGPTSVIDSRGGFRWHDDFRSGRTFPPDRLYLDVPIVLAEGTDIKVPWELSRFNQVFWFAWTDPEKYGPVFLNQWRDWQIKNPLARGVNWACTMDVALRAMSWTAATACWGRAWDHDTQCNMAAALADHGRFIRDNLEWGVPARTNHYFSDIVALAVLGVVLAAYPPAEGWLDFAERELSRETLLQFGADGFNKECSTTYHRLMVELATLGYLACRAGGRPLGVNVRERLTAAYRAIAVLCGTTGVGPLIGDNDSSRLFPLAMREDAFYGWLLPVGAELLDADELAIGPAPPELAMLLGPAALDRYERRSARGARSPSVALPESGVFVLGDDRSRMVVLCGPSAYEPTPGHGHLDQLSFSLTVDGLALLVDPGQFCYTPWPRRRDAYRATGAHNTVEIDGELQCRVFKESPMMYSIEREDEPQCLAFGEREGGILFQGMHRGYRRLKGGGDHLRQVHYQPEEREWAVTDTFNLSGRHEYLWNFCLHPQAVAGAGDNGWTISRAGRVVQLEWLSPASATSFQERSRFAAGYGKEETTMCLGFRCRHDGALSGRFQIRIA